MLEAGATKMLCGVLKFNNLITNLDLSGRGIEPDAAKTLAISVKHNTTLTSLNISDNPITDVNRYQTDKDVAATQQEGLSEEEKKKNRKQDTKGLIGLAEAVKLNSALSAVTLETTKGSTLPIETLKGGDKKSRIVDLARKGLSFISAVFIGILMRGNTQVTELVLNSNEITASGATGIVQQLSKSIKVLDISNVVLLVDPKADKKRSTSTAEIPTKRLVQLWSAVSALGALEKLDRLTMDRNHLTGIDSFAKLTSLKNLSMSNNAFVKLPDNIYLIAGLRSLTIHTNALRELPRTIGELENLERIDVRSNQLTYLPTTLSQLKNLKYVDASENFIQSLHPSVCDWHSIEKLELKDNPLVRPPAAIARNGIGAIRKFFQEMVMVGDVVSYGARLVFLGGENGGKTSLQQGLRAGKADPARHGESTIHFDVHEWMLGEGAKQMHLSVYDLASYRLSQPNIASCVTEGTLIMLTVPALDVAVLTANYDDYLGRWLRCLQINAPNAVVMPVLTKCDLCANNGPSGAEHRTPSAYASFASKQVAWLTEALERYIKDDGGKLNILFPVQCTSAISGGDASIDGLKTRVNSVIFAEGGSVLPSVYQAITRTVYLSTVFLRALRDGREPIDSARTADIGYIPSTMSMDVELATVPQPYVAYKDIETLYTDEFAPALKCPPTSEGLDGALTLLYNQGEIVPLPCGLIMLNPNFMARVFRPLTDHRMGKFLMEQMHDTFRSSLVPGMPISDVERLSITAAAEVLGASAILREELLLALWQAIGVRQEAFRDLTNLLRRIGVLAISEHTPNGRDWLMPTRLPLDEDIIARLSKKLGPAGGAAAAAAAAAERYVAWKAASAPTLNVEVLRVTVPIGPTLPPGAFERLVASCSVLGTYVKSWSKGGHLKILSAPQNEGRPRIQMDFLIQLSSKVDAMDVTQHEVQIESCTEKGMRFNAWASLVQIHRIFKSIIEDYPKLPSAPSAATLCCPGCSTKMMTLDDRAQYDATLWPLENVLAASQRCEACNDKVSLHQAPLLEDVPSSTSLIRQEAALMTKSRPNATDFVFSVDELRYGRPLEVFSNLAQLVGLRQEEVENLRSDGEAAIIAEFEAEADDETPGRWTKDEMGVYEWSELDWCLYLSASKAETVAKLTDDDEKARAEQIATLRQEAKDNGLIDAGRKDTSIDYWLKRPEMAAAGLSRGQVLALRLITSPVAAKINQALRNGCDDGRPHPYPATVILLCDGLSRLWSAQLEQRFAAGKAAAAATKELRAVRLGGDEEAIAIADSAAKQAVAEHESLKVGSLWQGVCGLSADAFKERGGTEIGFHRSCSSREVAQEQAVQQRLAFLAEQATVASVTLPLATEGVPEVSVVSSSGARASGKEEEEEEEVAYLAISNSTTPAGSIPRVTVSPTNDADAPDLAASADAAGQSKSDERPLLLLRIEASLNLSSAVNLSFLSPTSNDFYCLPPGAYYEQRKVAVEPISIGNQEEPLEAKIVDVLLHLPPSIAKQAVSLAEARVEGKAAREKAQ